MWSPLPLGAMWYSQNKRRNRDSSVCGTGLLSLSSVYAPYSGALLYSDQSWTTLSLCHLQRAQKILTNTFGTHCCVFQSSGSLEFLSRSICPFNRQHKFPKQVNLPACCLSRVSFLFFFFFFCFVWPRANYVVGTMVCICVDLVNVTSKVARIFSFAYI